MEFLISGGVFPYNLNWYDLQSNLLGTYLVNNSLFSVNTFCAGYKLFEVIDNNGCTATLSVDSDDPNPVEILEGLQVDANIALSSVSSANLCYGDSLGSAAVLNPNPLFVYDWYQNNNLLFADINSVNTLPGGDIYIMATYTDGNVVCSTSSSVVNIYQPAELTLSMTSTDVDCFGNINGTAAVNITGGISPYVEDWDSVNTNSLSAGVYPVVVTDANGCLASDSVTVTEPTALQSSINITSNMNMSADVTGGTYPYTYTWYFNMSLFGNDSICVPSFNGIYTLLVTDANGCTSTDTYNYTLISLNDLSNQSVSVYPNPFSDKLYIELIGVRGQIDYVVKMYDARGRLVVDRKMNTSIINIDREGLSKGLYFIEILGLDMLKIIQVD